MSDRDRIVVTLKEDWDHPQHYLRPEGHFVGRIRELDFLVDNIRRKKSGSILVSGSRGVGKTALVYKALQRVVDTIPKTVCAVLNVSDLEIEMGKNVKETQPQLEIRLKIVQNLIRRLYTSLMDQPEAVSKSDLAKLYMKAASKETVRQELLETEAAGRAETSKKITRTVRTPVNVGSILISLIAGILLSVHHLFPPGHPLFDALNLVLPLLVASIGPLTLIYVRETIEEKQSLTKDRMQAKEYYEFDGGLATLQFDLERCLDKLREMSYKVVFCIDELDKMENSALVIEIITSFKNLFNLSSAIFIVITGPEEYGLIDAARSARGVHYTLFTNRVFVPRPSFADLELFLDEIVERPDIQTLQGEDRWNEFRNYVCNLATSDFFDLYVVIRDFVIGYDHGKPLLEVPELDADQLTCARIQKCLGQIFGQYHKTHISEWADNDALFTDLNSFVSFLLHLSPNQTFDDAFGNITRSDFREARKDFCTYLARIEAIRRTGKTPAGANAYVWTGSCPPVPTRINLRLSYEQEFVEKYDKLMNEILRFTNAYLSGTGQAELSRQDFAFDMVKVLDLAIKAVDADFKAVFNQQKSIYEDLHSDFPDSHPRDQLVSFSKTLDEQTKVLYDRRFILVRNTARDSFKDATMVRFQENPALFSTLDELRKAVIQDNVEHAVLARKDLSKQIAVTHNLSAALIVKNKPLLNKNKNVLQILNVQTVPGLAYAKVRGFVNLDLTQEIQSAPNRIKGLAKWFER